VLRSKCFVNIHICFESRADLPVFPALALVVAVAPKWIGSPPFSVGRFRIFSMRLLTTLSSCLYEVNPSSYPEIFFQRLSDRMRLAPSSVPLSEFRSCRTSGNEHLRRSRLCFWPSPSPSLQQAMTRVSVTTASCPAHHSRCRPRPITNDEPFREYHHSRKPLARHLFCLPLSCS